LAETTWQIIDKTKLQIYKNMKF